MQEYRFSPFEKVLVRDSNLSTWICSFFSHYHEGEYYCTSGCFRQCIPFEGNELLAGTDSNVIIK